MADFFGTRFLGEDYSFILTAAAAAGIIGPLVIMMMYKEKSKFVERHAKEALNFDITIVIVIMVTCCFGAIVAGPVSLIYHILAAMAASRGEEFKYPWSWRLIK